MDSVNNRSLFRRKSQAARNKVREMGMVPQDQQPGGILASFRDLMEVAGRDRKQGLMPQVIQQMRPMQRMPMQGPMAAQGGIMANRPQPQPRVGMQEGGDVALERFRQTAAMPQMSNQRDPGLAQEFLAAQTSAMAPGVDITETPVPRTPLQTPDIGELVMRNLEGNPEAQQSYNDLRTRLYDQSAEPEEIRSAITEAAGLEDTPENHRQVVESITGTQMPSSATVDELNNAILGVSLGGAIGGPRSVAERISNAILLGLEAKRDTATNREDMEARMAIAAAGAGEGGVGSRDFRNPADAYQDAYIRILNSADFMTIPEGMTAEQYARQAAEGVVRRSYTPEQLRGTQFEGIHQGRNAPAAAPSGSNVITATDANGVVYYSQDGENFYDAQGNPYVEPTEGE